MHLKKLSGVHKIINYLIVIFFLTAVSAVNANELSMDRVVSLSHTTSGDDLIVAYSQSLIRYSTKSSKWVPIVLPASVDQITAVVASGEGVGSIYLAAPGTGVLQSSDNGETWDLRNKGLSSNNVTGLIRHASQPETLYSIIPKAGIFRSENSGNDWQLMDGGPVDMGDTIIHSDMPDSMQTGWIFASTKQGVSRSMDCFCLWRDAGSFAGEVTGITYDPNQPAHIYVATNDGMYLSQDGGANWESIETPRSDVTALFFTKSGDLFVGTRSGSLFRRGSQSMSWEELDVF